MSAAPVQPAVQLREAREEDLAEIVRIERAVFADPWSFASFADILRGGTARLAVAVRDGRIAGYSVAIHAADEVELANLAVAVTDRRSGVGRILLEDVLRFSRERGARRIYLEVRESNVAALGLYSAAGFTQVGRRRRYYSSPVEDAIIMLKTREI
jgi:ribosomal-protein-alanine N-acetyltransferase